VEVLPQHLQHINDIIRSHLCPAMAGIKKLHMIWDAENIKSCGHRAISMDARRHSKTDSIMIDLGVVQASHPHRRDLHCMFPSDVEFFMFKV